MKPVFLARSLAAACLALLAQTMAASGANFIADIVAETTPVVDASSDLPSLSGSYLAAQVAAANNDDEAAIANFKRSIELDPENTFLKQSLVMAYVANGDIDQALDLLAENPAESQTQNVGHLIVSANALKQKSWNRAITTIDRITGTDRDAMITALVGGWALYGDRKLDDALARIGKVGEPEWALMIGNYHKGLMLLGAGRDAEAVIALEDAVSFRELAAPFTETYMRAMEALARAYWRDGQQKRARAVLEEGMGLLRQHPPLVALEAAFDGNEAIQPLVVSAQQGAAEIFFNVGSAISRQGGLPFAQSHLQLALFLHPGNDAALVALAGIYERQNRHLRANQYYKLIEATSPYLGRVRLETALNYDKLGQPDEAETILRALIDEDPDNHLAVLSLGAVFTRQDAFAKAAEIYDPAISRITDAKKEHWSLYYRRGIAFERTKQWDKAEADFKKALELESEQADVLNYLGYSWVDMGIHLEEGMDMIRKAVELRPNSGFIIDSLGWAHYRLGEYENAVEHLERALLMEPSDPVVIDHLGDAYWQTGRKLEAVFQWKHALANDPEEAERAKIEEKLRSGLTN